MTHDGPGPTALFDELMAEVTGATGQFDHRAHVHLTWLAIRRVGMPAAVRVVSDGIHQAALHAGAPQKYRATVSRAWVELVAHHAAERAATERAAVDFAGFIDAHPALLDKRLLTRFYRPTTLAGSPARTHWVEPDLDPFPWDPRHRHR
ncbi:hypothetical protein I6A60_23680 [Frankia sp. AgB1.9]|uniref:hypothetical protein n=1 Tax=unclassified Frankia TaxID=2632575 RepID=UPI0019348982|nr:MULTISPECIES: hypothetical protein [unclassified Frankia]MBL7491711.1 hypothetical protein [Frankia sp. AgW1.1]MBL7550846.1 hypothetical protein [Frankia sp. AgB1.9]MBL7625167.1 hypothetical protein [Frankia sp. AgB1.8]